MKSSTDVFDRKGLRGMRRERNVIVAQDVIIVNLQQDFSLFNICIIFTIECPPGSSVHSDLFNSEMKVNYESVKRRPACCWVGTVKTNRLFNAEFHKGRTKITKEDIVLTIE